MSEDRGYCEICNYEWSPEARPRYCPRCDFPTSSDHAALATSGWTEEEWQATMKRAEAERPCSNHPLPLTPAEIDALAEQIAAERRIAEYNARAIDWMMERIVGRNTP